jgi:CrcB protein
MSITLTYLLIGIGSALGGMGRHLLSTLIDSKAHGAFPWGILTVNILGCLAMGVAFGLIDRSEYKLLLMSGVLGGFTTFSAFSLITLDLVQHGRWDLAGAYVAASVIGCLVAIGLGFYASTLLKFS